MDKISQSNRMVTGWLIMKDGKIGLALDENQQLGTKCHDIVDKAIPQTGEHHPHSDPEKIRVKRYEEIQRTNTPQRATSRI